MTETGRALSRFEPAEALPSRGTARRSAVSAILIGVAVANAAIILWLWLNGGGLVAVHSIGDLLTSSGRVTGLLGAYLALIQVLLLARLPFLEHLAGFDRLTVWHRVNGKACLYLVLAHTVLITLGYAALDKLGVVDEIRTLLATYPGMVTATVGTALFVVVVVSSFVIVRRRLRYEAWYAVHLTAYAAIALAWFHQIPTGNEFVLSRVASDYWTSLYVVTAALLVAFRLIVPTVHTFKYQLRVEAVVPESNNVVSVFLTGRRLDRLKAQPGQFFLWRFLSRGRWWEAHPFSLSAAPTDRSLRITAKNLGDFSSKLPHLKPGTRVVAEGPFGVFTQSFRKRDRVALIAGGIGITPIRALAESIRGDAVLLYRAMSENDLIFRKELDAIAAERGIKVEYVVGDHRTPEGQHLLSAEHLRELVPDITDRDVYVCGPPAMVDVLERTILAAGVPRKYIHAERFAL